MLKKLFLLTAVLSSGSVYADSYEMLQQQLRSRDAAILDMQNRIDSNEQVIRNLQGEIDDLKYHLNQFEIRFNSLQKQVSDMSSKSGISAEVGQVSSDASQAGRAGTDKVAPTSSAADKKQVSSVAPTGSDEQKAYDLAFAKVSSNDFSGAKTAFAGFIDSYPNSKLLPNCYYWLGQMAYKQQKYDEAKQNFLKVTQYSDSQKRADSIFKLGQVSQATRDDAKARKFYQLVIKSYPNTTEAVMAQRALESIR